MKNIIMRHVRIFYPVLIAIVFLILTSCASSLPHLPSSQERLRIAVVGMKKGIVDQKVADMLITALSKSDYFTVVEREKINRVIEEQKFQLSGIVDPETAVKLGELLDVQAVVKGEIVNTKVQPINWVIALTVKRTATVTAQVIDVRDGKTIAAVSETGGSWAGGVPAEITYSGKTKQDILGVKRSEDDMFNAAVRNAIDKVAVSIIKTIYENDKKASEIMDAYASPNWKIESLTKDIPDTNHFVALAKVYYAPFDVVWIAVNRYLETQGSIVVSDRDKGIVIIKKSTSDFKLQDVSIVERVSEDSTKITVKGFCYKYSCYQGGYCGWEKLGSDFCSNISLNGIKKRIKK